MDHSCHHLNYTSRNMNKPIYSNTSKRKFSQAISKDTQTELNSAKSNMKQQHTPYSTGQEQDTTYADNTSTTSKWKTRAHAATATNTPNRSSTKSYNAGTSRNDSKRPDDFTSH